MNDLESTLGFGIRRQGLAAMRVAAQSRKGKRQRPQLVALEDRRLLSTFMVTDTSDDATDPGSLRYGVINEPSGTTITFAQALTGTILLFPEGPINITKSLDIEGPGAGILTISGGGGNGIFTVAAGISVTINGLTLAHGMAGQGAAIDNKGDLTATNDTFTSDFAEGVGGEIFNESGATLLLKGSTLSGNVAVFGAAISNKGTLTVTDDSFTTNSGTGTRTTGAGGGAIHDSGPELSVTGSKFTGNKNCYFGGGITVASGVVTIADSTFDSNSAIHGGSIYNGGTLSMTNCTISNSAVKFDADNAGGQGGGIKNVGTLKMTGCTINNNMAEGDGGGIANVGSLTLVNCTIAGNKAPDSGTFDNGHGGGILTYGTDLGSAFISDCTISGNSAVDGGGIDCSGTDAGSLTLINTIIAGNHVNGGTGPDLNGSPTTDNGNNLFGNSSGGSGFAASDLLNVDPLLAALGNYGGPTETFALLPGSPAIDAGNNAGIPAGITTDQRGPGYPRIVSGSVDIGAFESSGFNVTVTGGDDQQTAVGTPFPAALSVTVVSLAHDEPVAGGLVTFSAPPSGDFGHSRWWHRDGHSQHWQLGPSQHRSADGKLGRRQLRRQRQGKRRGNGRRRAFDQPRQSGLRATRRRHGPRRETRLRTNAQQKRPADRACGPQGFYARI